jgi:2-dehydropantoate 2-reductase
MRVVVLGTGAVGSYFAARLARSGVAVTVAGSWPAGLEAIRAGIVVEEPGDSFRVSVPVARSGGPLPEADIVLVLVKSPQTAGIAAVASRALTPGGLLVTLQNGLGNREILEASAGPGRVAIGVTRAGFTLRAPGRVRAIPGLTILGDEPALLAPIAPLAVLLQSAGLPTETTPDVERLVWRKLVANCAINALSALLGVANGALSQGPRRVSLEGVAREVGAVARARGIDLDADPAQLALEVARATAANNSSMLQDLQRGAPTEIDALCGAVTLEGRRLGVPTPLNEQLWRQVLARQAQPATC